MTVSLGGYPRGYIAEPQQSSFRPSARPRIYPRIHPEVYSWSCPGSISGFIPGRIPGPARGSIPRPTRGSIPGPGVIPIASAVVCGPGEATRLNAGDLRPRKPQSLHAPEASRGVDTVAPISYYGIGDYIVIETPAFPLTSSINILVFATAPGLCGVSAIICICICVCVCICVCICICVYTYTCVSARVDGLLARQLTARVALCGRTDYVTPEGHEQRVKVGVLG